MIEDEGDAFRSDDRKAQTIRFNNLETESHEGNTNKQNHTKATSKNRIAQRQHPKKKLHDGDTNKQNRTKATPKNRIA
jgi:hypothetical protein